VGCTVSSTEGSTVGSTLSSTEGSIEGTTVSSTEGVTDGVSVGAMEGATLSSTETLGATEGEGVGVFLHAVAKRLKESVNTIASTATNSFFIIFTSNKNQLSIFLYLLLYHSEQPIAISLVKKTCFFSLNLKICDIFN
jgi:hypothetical protein